MWNIIVTLQLLLYAANNHTQPTFQHGSYQIAAICSDGIVIGTDTRIAINDRRGNILAYYDTVQKVYDMPGFIISSSGAYLLNDKYPYFYYHLFSQQPQQADTSLLSTILGFYKFLRQTDKSAYRLVTQRNKLLFAQYEGTTPIIGILEKGRIDTVKNEGFICEDDLSGFPYNPTVDCATMARVIETTIQQYVARYHKSHEINTYISVLKITPGNHTEWILHPPKHPAWQTETDFFKAMQQNEIQVYFTSPKAEQLLRQSWP
ncbi:hypothetical protein LX64_00834 [Chitinophaga skermanii]|uniref:Uncharacterized protein n=1 Tax=Chitinophaga skermanii TaxID=331697 RepID=A0A327R2R8_9BACT|nr:hypothetical protein [Chitinophaga skermanii]RAJ08187.1 hypothetical protein LX64_00834 [Chitinophaga skermanii]